MNKAEVLRAIIGGELDDARDDIIEAVKARDRQLRDQKVAFASITMTPGTKVRVNGNISPKALVGLTGEVVSKTSTRADIKLDDMTPGRTFSLRRYVRDGVLNGVPLSVLEVVS